MEYKIITDEDGFLAEKEAWNAICSQMPEATPFQTWEWNYHWWKHHEPADSLFLIQAFENRQVWGYAPMVVKNGAAEFIGSRHMDYGCFIAACRQVELIAGFVKLLREKGYGLALQEIPARNPQLHILQRLLENHRKCILRKTTRTVYVDLTKYDTMAEYIKQLSQSMRNKTIKPGMKSGLRIQKEPVTQQLLKEIEEIYKDRQEERGGEKEISWSFSLIKELYSEGMLDVYVARKEGTAVGFLVSMERQKRRFIWLVAFKMAYRDSFPGQMLFYSVLHDGFEDGCEVVDFMRGDYDFKLRWECALDTNYTVYVCRNGWDYWRKRVFFAVKPLAKKLVYSVPLLERIYKNRG